MKSGLDKLAAMVLALLMLVLPEILSAGEKKGANLVITLKDGQNVSGKLIAVKPDSLLLLADKGESIDLVRIRSIRIVKKDKAALGAICGVLAGWAGSIVYAKSQKDDLDQAFAGLSWLVFVPGGAGLGLGAGLLAGKDKTIQLEGKPESEVRQALAYLRGKARIPDYK